jgi:hypothetical protein
MRPDIVGVQAAAEPLGPHRDRITGARVVDGDLEDERGLRRRIDGALEEHCRAKAAGRGASLARATDGREKVDTELLAVTNFELDLEGKSIGLNTLDDV